MNFGTTPLPGHGAPLILLATPGRERRALSPCLAKVKPEKVLGLDAGTVDGLATLLVSAMPGQNITGFGPTPTRKARTLSDTRKS